MPITQAASDGTTSVIRGPLITVDAGSVQSMVANTSEGFEAHLIVNLHDEPLTRDQALQLGQLLNQWALEGKLP